LIDIVDKDTGCSETIKVEKFIHNCKLFLGMYFYLISHFFGLMLANARKYL